MSSINPAAARARETSRNQRTGEFGVQQHNDPAHDLPAKLPVDGTPVPVRATYMQWRHGLPTPRHRKERYYTVEAEYEVAIPSFDSEHAPVAATLDGSQWRLADGQWVHLARETEPEEWVRSEVNGTFDSDAAQREERTSNAVLIDGEVWETGMEPVYQVRTYGLGGNHGGTSLHATTRLIPEDGDAPHDGTFAVTELDAAKAKAKEVALGRGDTESVERIDRYEGEWEITDAVADAPAVLRPVELEFPEGDWDERWQMTAEQRQDAARDDMDQVHDTMRRLGVLHEEPGRAVPVVDWSRVSDYDRSRYRSRLLEAYGLDD